MGYSALKKRFFFFCCFFPPTNSVCLLSVFPARSRSLFFTIPFKHKVACDRQSKSDFSLCFFFFNDFSVRPNVTFVADLALKKHSLPFLQRHCEDATDWSRMQNAQRIIAPCFPFNMRVGGPFWKSKNLLERDCLEVYFKGCAQVLTLYPKTSIELADCGHCASEFQRRVGVAEKTSGTG